MKQSSAKIWRRITVFFAVLLVITFTAYNAANIKFSAIRSVLGGETSRIVKGEEGDEDTEYFKRLYTSEDALKAYLEEVCYDLESEGIVLLRNEEVDGTPALPLAKGSRVSLFGQGSVVFNYSTTGSSNTGTNRYPSLKDGLKDLEVNQDLWEFYLNGAAASYRREFTITNGYRMNEAPWSVYEQAAIPASFAGYGDAAIYVLSRDSGEGKDLTTIGSDGEDGSYLSLTKEEREVLEHLTSLKRGGTFRKLIVLLNSAVPLQLDFLFDDAIEVDAALWVGNVGSTGVYAIGDVLVGNVIPSGKLSDTFAKDNFSSPAMAAWEANPDKSFSLAYTNAAEYPAFSKDTQTVYAVYAEGIYVGYRYYETRFADQVMGQGNAGNFVYEDEVAYPFGYGLSYTDFWYDDLAVVETEDTFQVSVRVLNAGAYDAKEVVQVYLQKPYTEYDRANGVEKSAVELAGFAKVSLLSGQEKTVTIDVDKSLLASYDANGKGTYILENGEYYLTVASDAHEAVNQILAVSGYESEGQDTKEAEAMTWRYTVSGIPGDGVDAETFAQAEATGNRIENLFDFADMNRYEGRGENKVTYVSRSDWEGTWPTAPIRFAITETMASDIASHKPLVEDGSVMPAYSQDNSLTIAMLRGLTYTDSLWDDLLNQMTFEEQSLLITNGQHNTVVVDSVGKPATIDENGPNGVTHSTTSVTFPSEGIWASTFNRALLYEVGTALAEDAVEAGITGLYAPGLNLHRVPFGGRAHEYFSEDPFLMGICTMVEVQGIQSRGVWAYVKHYAVNDKETNRAGVAIWLNEQELREIVLRPFEYAVRPDMGNAHAMMTSFNRIGCVWTSASHALMEDALRGEWGFDGFAITDMASANAQTFMVFDDGIANGTDCFDGAGSENALNAYKGSAMFANKMRESAHRILYVTANYSAAMNGIRSSDRIVKVLTWWQVAINVAVGVTALLTALSGLMYVASRKKKG
ncbi:MAG: glycoside hydrolase family 3 C-terminal domain-containing protein [Lachnospiraceae bacterium]|nr:glycoside hydrolase family 3 C-terminal domain-containing protein [Lachnospiraceae bacterium]